MEKITFDKVPEALGRVLDRLAVLEQLLIDQQRQPQAKEEKEVLLIDEAAKLLGLKKATIYGKVHREAIPHSKPGKHLYFNRQELLEWIQASRKKTTAEIQAEATPLPRSKQKGI